MATRPIPTLTSTAEFDAKAGKPCYTWYEVYGDLKSGITPVIVLHGARQRRLDAPPEKTGEQASFWTQELFVDELDNLIRHLGIQDNYSILGQSWGGMLAALHAVKQPKGLKRLVLANSPASIQMFVKIAYEKLVPGLPSDIAETILKHEKEGTTSAKEYQDAMTVFYKRHLCRVDPYPEELQQSFAADPDSVVYHAMNGPSEFHITGPIKDFDITQQAHKINVPTLLISGRYDEVDEASVAPYFKTIPQVKWITFAESSHTPHMEERERYMRVVSDFFKA
ncbi:prolyl aminopeptidase-2 [Epithele typhae]|uniref:prolyl aminopeptidase-2 n=1 Tax=Epithele typhae TaxID=378194 RepID=UPI00200769F2|nr:prolyl aminopeptidase-2 [Epithele typhae]KAH9943376.1 prolyl aminopeptidase-2 [Epithele typhae]